MCAVFGAVVSSNLDRFATTILQHIAAASLKRGRDGYGISVKDLVRGDTSAPHSLKLAGANYKRFNLVIGVEDATRNTGPKLVVGNTRAEPTTEYVKVKSLSDQQPYSLGDWTIVHNGTIANDKELRTNQYYSGIDSAAIVESLGQHSDGASHYDDFHKTVFGLKGSFAIVAMHHNSKLLYVAANYRPLWWIQTPVGVFFASARDFFPKEYVPQMLPPYSSAAFNEKGLLFTRSLYKEEKSKKALVVCSGGLDSVVSAVYAKQQLGFDIELIHFLYGSRAQGPEVDAVRAVAKELDVPLRLFPLNVYSKSDSPLLDPNSELAGGEAGAEFAHEWVPARNLLLLSVATAYAEANGHSYLVLGNNLEEAGAYPDNEPEFINKFNDMLPFAIGDGKRLEVVMPVGNMMKHEIVALGHALKAPMHLTWSCYRAGEQHCGKCGPCFMRRTAFEINNLPEVISYKD